MKQTTFSWLGVAVLAFMFILALTALLPNTLAAQERPVTTPGDQTEDRDAAHHRPEGGCQDGDSKRTYRATYRRPYVFKVQVIPLSTTTQTTVDTIELNKELDLIDFSEENQNLEEVLVLIQKYKIKKYKLRITYKRRKLLKIYYWECIDGGWRLVKQRQQRNVIPAGTKVRGPYTQEKFDGAAFRDVVDQDIAAIETITPSDVEIPEDGE